MFDRRGRRLCRREGLGLATAAASFFLLGISNLDTALRFLDSFYPRLHERQTAVDHRESFGQSVAWTTSTTGVGRQYHEGMIAHGGRQQEKADGNANFGPFEAWNKESGASFNGGARARVDALFLAQDRGTWW